MKHNFKKDISFKHYRILVDSMFLEINGLQEVENFLGSHYCSQYTFEKYFNLSFNQDSEIEMYRDFKNFTLQRIRAIENVLNEIRNFIKEPTCTTTDNLGEEENV